MRDARRRQAFTLIELLAASALSALLVLVLFQVLGSLTRSRAGLERAAVDEEQSATQTAWKSDLLDLLRWDLTNASDVSIKPGLVVLTGHGALDRRSLAATQEPVTVVYRVEHRGTANCLVRHQVSRNGLSAGSDWSELVCADVTGFEASRIEEAAAQAPSTRVRIAGSGGLIFDEVIVVK
jgi:prepilin-type N-terminal cleavage/methylation domain-containing protein